MAENAGLITFTVILVLVLIVLVYFLGRSFGLKRLILKLFGYEASSDVPDEERSILSKYEQLTNESIEDSKETFVKEIKTPVSPPYQNKIVPDSNSHVKQTTTNSTSRSSSPSVVKPSDLKPSWLADDFSSRTVSNNDWTEFRQALKSPMAQPQFRYIVTQESVDTAPGPIVAARPKIKEDSTKAAAKADSPPTNFDSATAAAATVVGSEQQLQSPSPSRVASPRGSGEFDSDSMLILDDDKSSRRTSISSIDSSLDEPQLNALTRALSTDSVDSTYSMNELTSDSEIGQLEVRLQYDSANQYLFVWILQAYDVRLTTGPDVELWVVLFLLPHPKPLWRTQLQKYSSVVSFHEKFRQRVRDQDLKKIACLCQLYSRKISSANCSELLGQAKVRLKDIELAIANTLWLTLLPPSSDAESDNNDDKQQLGELFFSLNYLPTAERLTVVIGKAKNLRDINGEVPKNVMVRVYLVQGAKISRKKTSTKSAIDGSIAFNESMIFSLTQNNISKVSLRLSVVQLLKIGEQGTIGQVTVGARRIGKEFGHWQKMIEQPRKPASMWHSLMPKKQP